MAPNFTNSDRSKMKYLKNNEKVAVLCDYLFKFGGSHNSTAQRVFGGTEQKHTQAVSTICRSYGLSGQNAGLFAPNGLFQRKYGYVPTEAEIRGFVSKFSQGSIDQGITIESYFANRSSNSSGFSSQLFSQYSESSSSLSRFKDENAAEGFDENTADALMKIIGFVIVAIIVYFIFFK